MIVEARADGRTCRVEVRARDGGYEVTIDDRSLRVDLVPAGRRDFVSLLVDSHSYDVGLERHAEGYRVVFADDTLDIHLTDAVRGVGGVARKAGGPARVTAPMPGKLIGVLVEVGQQVTAGQGLVVMEAMKMENELRSPRDGRVTQLPAAPGQAVETGALLVVVE